MTLIRGENGTYRALFRRKGMRDLHVSLRTDKKKLAQDRHDAVRSVVREGRDALLDQLRSGVVSIERVTAMVRQQEPLQPITPALLSDRVTASPWDTVDDACKRYRTAMRGNPNIEARTEKLAGFQLDRLCAFEYEGQRLGDLPLDRVPSKAVHAYQTSMVDAETPPNTITTYMSRVGALWAWAIEQEQRDARDERRPARELFTPVVSELLYRETRRRERMLTVAEADRLLASTPDPLLWFVGCGLLAGLRAGETLHLRPGIDVDLDIGTIAVRDQADWKPKTTRSRRMVPMAPSLHDIARRHAKEWANESWMMPSPVDPALPVTDLGVRPHFRAVVERAGLIYGRDDLQGVTFHTLRHSFASHAVMRGVDLYTVAKLLGDTMKTVEDVYADLSPDFKRIAVAKLAGAFTIPDQTVTARVTEIGEAS